MARKYFAAYHSYLESIAPLDDAERGRLFTACLQYSKSGEAPELCGNERFIFACIKPQIDRDGERYEKRCEVNRKNGARGGYAKANGRALSGGAKEEKKTASPENLPDGLRDAMERFKDHRERLHTPMTDYAVSRMLARLGKLSGGSETKKIAILNQSIEQGWKGVFALDAGRPPGRRSVKHDYPQHRFTEEQLARLYVNLDEPAPGAEEETE